MSIHYIYNNVYTLLIIVITLSVKITVRVPKELKKRMEKYRYINWSEVIRRAIEAKIREEEIKRAIEIMDEIASKAKPSRDTSEIIREFRDSRK